MKGILVTFVYLNLFAIVLSQDGPVINTVSGKVRGTTVSVLNGITVNCFLGIPFAQPPVTERRFQKPSPVKPWNGIYNATKFSKSCYQAARSDVSEDCLYLNVWSKPSGKILKPVLVWIYGGGFTSGSSSGSDGSILAALHDVIVVSMNYRLGAFGFLNAYTEDVPGNMGLYDQSLALKWVVANAEYFGGNANNITLFGDSAGSWSVHAHIMSPLDNGLFKRAIMMSGSQFHPVIVDSPEISLKKSNNLAKILQCANDSFDFSSNPTGVTKCLKSKSSGDILAVSGSFPFSFYPSFNTEVLPFSSLVAARLGKFNHVDVVAGTTTGEGYFANRFLPPDVTTDNLNNITIPSMLNVVLTGAKSSPMYPEGSLDALNFYFDQAIERSDIRDSLRDFIGDNFFICPTVYFLEHYSDQNPNVYHYQFSHRSSLTKNPKWMKASHGSDPPYVFGKPLQGESFTEEDKKFSLTMMKLWTSFAQTGVPAKVNGTEWIRFSRQSPAYIDLNGKQIRMQQGLRKPYCDFWRKYFYTF